MSDIADGAGAGGEGSNKRRSPTGEHWHSFDVYDEDQDRMLTVTTPEMGSDILRRSKRFASSRREEEEPQIPVEGITSLDIQDSCKSKEDKEEGEEEEEEGEEDMTFQQKFQSRVTSALENLRAWATYCFALPTHASVHFLRGLHKQKALIAVQKLTAFCEDVSVDQQWSSDMIDAMGPILDLSWMEEKATAAQKLWECDLRSAVLKLLLVSFEALDGLVLRKQVETPMIFCPLQSFTSLAMIFHAGAQAIVNQRQAESAEAFEEDTQDITTLADLMERVLRIPSRLQYGQLSTDLVRNFIYGLKELFSCLGGGILSCSSPAVKAERAISHLQNMVMALIGRVSATLVSFESVSANKMKTPEVCKLVDDAYAAAMKIVQEIMCQGSEFRVFVDINAQVLLKCAYTLLQFRMDKHLTLTSNVLPMIIVIPIDKVLRESVKTFDAILSILAMDIWKTSGAYVCSMSWREMHKTEVDPLIKPLHQALTLCDTSYSTLFAICMQRLLLPFDDTLQDADCMLGIVLILLPWYSTGRVGLSAIDLLFVKLVDKAGRCSFYSPPSLTALRMYNATIGSGCQGRIAELVARLHIYTQKAMPWDVKIIDPLVRQVNLSESAVRSFRANRNGQLISLLRAFESICRLPGRSVPDIPLCAVLKIKFKTKQDWQTWINSATMFVHLLPEFYLDEATFEVADSIDLALADYILCILIVFTQLNKKENGMVEGFEGSLALAGNGSTNILNMLVRRCALYIDKAVAWINGERVLSPDNYAILYRLTQNIMSQSTALILDDTVFVERSVIDNFNAAATRVLKYFAPGIRNTCNIPHLWDADMHFEADITRSGDECATHMIRSVVFEDYMEDDLTGDAAEKARDEAKKYFDNWVCSICMDLCVTAPSSIGVAKYGMAELTEQWYHHETQPNGVHTPLETRLTITTCGHVIHSACWIAMCSSNVETEAACPLCRRSHQARLTDSSLENLRTWLRTPRMKLPTYDSDDSASDDGNAAWQPPDEDVYYSDVSQEY